MQEDAWPDIIGNKYLDYSYNLYILVSILIVSIYICNYYYIIIFIVTIIMSVIISYHIPHIHHITHIAPLVVVFGRRPGREIWELPVVVSVRFAQGQKERKRQGQTCTQCWALPMPQWLKLSQIDSMNSQWTLNELSMNSQWPITSTINYMQWLLCMDCDCSSDPTWRLSSPF